MSKNVEDFKEQLAEEFEKIDWDADDIEILGIKAWGPWKEEMDGKEIGNDGGFLIQWGKPHCGFGELSFRIEDGNLRCRTEAMKREFVEKVLAKVARIVEIDD